MASRFLFRLPAARSFRPITTTITARPFTSTHLPLRAQDSQDLNRQDRNSINRESDEYSKTGTDDSSAAQEEAAFDPSTTDPQAEKHVAGQGDGEGNPLDVSPANQEVSKPRGKMEGGAANSGKEEGAKQSGHGSPKKAGGQ